jgi:hypothetical protein
MKLFCSKISLQPSFFPTAATLILIWKKSILPRMGSIAAFEQGSKNTCMKTLQDPAILAVHKIIFIGQKNHPLDDINRSLFL